MKSSEHYQIKIHENPVNILMVYSQDFQMFFYAIFMD